MSFCWGKWWWWPVSRHFVRLPPKRRMNMKMIIFVGGRWGFTKGWNGLEDVGMQVEWYMNGICMGISWDCMRIIHKDLGYDLGKCPSGQWILKRHQYLHYDFINIISILEETFINIHWKDIWVDSIDGNIHGVLMDGWDMYVFFCRYNINVQHCDFPRPMVVRDICGRSYPKVNVWMQIIYK